MGKRQVKRQDKKIKNRGWRDLLLAFFVVLCAVYIIACTMPQKGRIINNTYVNHVDVSGLSPKQAAARIQEDFEKSYAHQTLTVQAVGRKYSVLINDSLEIDADAAAKKAYSFAHGSFLTRGIGVLRAALIKQRFSWNAHVSDDEALKKAVKESGLLDINTTTQTEYNIKGDELIFKKGAVGVLVDQPALIKELKSAVKNEDYVSVINSPMKNGTVKETDMKAVYKKVHTKKRNATLDPEKDYQIVRSQRGIDFDVKSAQEAFDAAREGGQVVIPLDVEKADVTTDDLKKHLFKNVLGECTTDVGGTDARVSNVKLAAKKVNGTILLAGESFSYNKTVGERTEERGFRMAAYSNGQTVRELGGGICQVSSTLYKAAMLSDLRIDERQNHTYISNYIDIGMDATVSWDGPDFCFTNNTKYPIRIDVEYSDGQVTVKLEGAKLDKNRVEITAETLEVIEHDIIYQEDPKMLKGESVVASSGIDGYVVQTYRNIYDKDDRLISSKKEAYCEYKSKAAVIREGIREPEPATVAETSETSETSGTTGESDTSKEIDMSETSPENQ